LVRLPGASLTWDGSGVKLLVAGLMGWTAAVVALALFWPNHLNTPGCAHKINVSAACWAQMAAENEELFWRDTFPLLATVVGGYVLVAVVAIVLARRSRARAS
jgi:hypothetical protein